MDVALEPQRQLPKLLEASNMVCNDAVDTVVLDARHEMMHDVRPGERDDWPPSRSSRRLNHHLPIRLLRLLPHLDDWLPL